MKVFNMATGDRAGKIPNIQLVRIFDLIFEFNIVVLDAETGVIVGRISETRTRVRVGNICYAGDRSRKN